MRWNVWVWYALAQAVACVAQVDARSHLLQLRQDDAGTSSTSSIAAAATSTSGFTVQSGNAATTTIAKQSQYAPTATGLDDAAAATTSTAQHLTSASPTGTISLPSSTVLPGQLPLQPTITPGLGVAGGVLIIAGAALAIIGVKKRWLHIFLGSALLAALGVTVLVLYVMNPPVNDAVQGAYFVAACVSGLVFGAICLMFKEITEGLVCLLGGFCLSMWFLVLKPGGLITGRGGVIIFIVVFSAAGWVASFTHFTATYALMFCTAFAGATAVVLGIDCFSKAGLKEFWLYVWGAWTFVQDLIGY